MERYERLKIAREDAGYETAEDAAKALGVKYPTYSAHENGSRGFRYESAEQYARKFGVSVTWLMTGRGSRDSVQRAVERIQYSSPADTFKRSPNPDHQRFGDKLDQIRLDDQKTMTPLRLLGDVAAGMWLEADYLTDEEPTETRYLPALGVPQSAQYFVRVRGQSLNKIALPGDLLWCMDYLEAGIDFRDGDLAVIERTRDSGQTIERTAKRVMMSPAGVIELRPESTDPRHQESVPYNEGDEDSTEVRIRAKVICILKNV